MKHLSPLSPLEPLGPRPTALVRLLVSLLVVLVLPVAASAAGDVDTFYQRLFEDGVDLATQGEFSKAADKLRLACFGMLEQPAMLGPCLGHLLVAQDAAGATESDLESTVDRLLEVEKLFRGWTETLPRYAPSAELRRRVETLFARFGTAESLARIPSLAELARRKLANDVAALPIEERKKQLNLLVQRQASIPLWHVMSAELSLDSGDPRAAERAADEILGTFAGNGPARCVRGRARATLGLCDGAAVDDLMLCPGDHARRVDIDQALLTCLVEVGRWREADGVLGRLPADRQETSEVRKLKRRIEKQRESEGATSAPGVDVPSGGSAGAGDAVGKPQGIKAETDPPKANRHMAPVYAPPPGLDEPAPSEPTPELADLPDDDRETLRRVRDALTTEQRDEYESLWAPARKVAKRHDGSAVAQRLAGSLAFHLGKWREAVRFLRRDESLASSRPELRLDLAMALHYLGEREEARLEFARCRQDLAPGAWVEFWAAELGADT